MTSASMATSETSTPSWLESFSESLKQRELAQGQWDTLRSLALRSLAKSTSPWDSPWGERYSFRCAGGDYGPEGVIALGKYVFLNSPAEHHADMLTQALEAIYNRTNTVILEPRGAAKTTWGNTTLISWLVAMFPDLRIGLISNTAKQSNDFSRAVRWTLESNTRFHEIFGDLVSPSKWTDVEWLRKDSRWHGSKDVTLYSAGAGGAIISKRFDLILCDDILDEENTATPEAREKVETWFFKTLLPCLVPDGVVLCLGTRWAEDDLYDILTRRVKDGGKGWKKVIRSAMVPDDSELGWHSYWPEHWPTEALIDKLVELGSALFSCAYNNDISGLMAGNVFRSDDWKGDNFYFEDLPAGHAYSLKMGIDLASSEKQRADFTARIVTAHDQCLECTRKGHLYVLHAYRDKRETGHEEFVHDGWQAFPAIGLVRIEKQQFQSTLVQGVMKRYPFIPVEGVQQDVDKVTRARAVAAKYEAHMVHHHVSLKGSPFEHELLAFPKGHDDFVDAEGLSFDLGGGGLTYGAARR